MATMNLNGDRLIRLSPVDSKANYLAGFWQWVELLAADDYQGALEALYWPNGTSLTTEKLKERVTTFFGGDAPWSVVVPSDRLVGVINDAADFQPRNREDRGWFMAQVPVTPSRPIQRTTRSRSWDLPLRSSCRNWSGKTSWSSRSSTCGLGKAG